MIVLVMSQLVINNNLCTDFDFRHGVRSINISIYFFWENDQDLLSKFTGRTRHLKRNKNYIEFQDLQTTTIAARMRRRRAAVATPLPDPA